MTSREVRENLQKIEGLVRTIEGSADPNVRASAVDLMKALMELHGAGIERMMDIAFEDPVRGAETIDRFADDELVAGLMLLYGLHPLDFDTRVRQALEKVRPYLLSHKGDVELLATNDGVVRLHLRGSCDGCASSAMTLELAIEEAIYDAAPDLVAIEVEGMPEPVKATGLVQISASSARTDATAAREHPGWEDVAGAVSISSGSVASIEIRGRPVLFCRVGETLYAYGNACANCGGTLAEARLDATSLVCPSCGERFDALRAGRALDRPSLHLEPFPLLVETGRAKIALPALRASA